MVEACHSCYAQVWRGVAVAPHLVVNAFEVELVAQETVLPYKLIIVAALQCLFPIILRYAFCVKQACLSKENGLYLYQAVAMLAQGQGVERVCPLLEHLALYAESEAADGDFQQGVIPSLVTKCEYAIYDFSLFFKPFGKQACKTAVEFFVR